MNAMICKLVRILTGTSLVILRVFQSGFQQRYDCWCWFPGYVALKFRSGICCFEISMVVVSAVRYEGLETIQCFAVILYLADIRIFPFGGSKEPRDTERYRVEVVLTVHAEHTACYSGENNSDHEHVHQNLFLIKLNITGDTHRIFCPHCLF